MASGNTLLVFSPLANEPPATSYATLDTRNSHPCLDFDADADESAVFSGVLPQNYAGTTGVTVYLHVAATSATSGASRWLVAWEEVTGLDIDADSFATAKSAAITANGTSGIPTIGSIAFTNGAEMDSVGAGDAFRLKVTRDADGTSGTDDQTGDAELLRVEIRET